MFITLRSLENVIAFPMIVSRIQQSRKAEIVILKASPLQLAGIDGIVTAHLFVTLKVVPSRSRLMKLKFDGNQ